MAGTAPDQQVDSYFSSSNPSCNDCEFDLHIASADFGFQPEEKDFLFARLRSFSVDETDGGSANSVSTCESRKLKRKHDFPEPSCVQWEGGNLPKFDCRPPPFRTAPSDQLPLAGTDNGLHSGSFSTWKALRVKSLEERQHERKTLALNLLKYLWSFNSTELAKLIQRHCHNQVMYISPTIRDPIFGKQDLMLLFALTMEQYPDSTAPILSAEVEDDKVVIVFDFNATNICPSTLDGTFRELKSKITRSIIPPGVISLAVGQRIIDDIADRIRPGVVQRLEAIAKNASPDRDTERKSGDLTSEDERDRYSTDESGVQPTVITLHKDFDMQGYLRTSSTGNVIMKEGMVSFRRQLNFYFDDHDKIIRMTSFNI